MTEGCIIFPVVTVVPVGNATLVVVASCDAAAAAAASTPQPVTMCGVMVTDPGREFAKVVATRLLDCTVVTPGIGA
jgi:hypothetical protein